MKILLLAIVTFLLSVSAQSPEPHVQPHQHQPEPSPIHPEPQPHHEPSPFPNPEPSPQSPGPEPSPYPYGPQPSPEPLPEYIHWIELGLTIAAMVFGLLWVFLGYRLVRIVFFLAGAVLLFFITFSLLELYATFAMWIKYVIAAGAALAGGLLLIVVLKIGFFIFGALTGMTLALLIIGGTPLAGMIHAIWIKWTAVGGAALLCAILAVIFEKPVTIVASSISGSYLIFSAVDNMWLHTSFSDILSNIFNGKPKPFDITDWRPYALIAAVVVLAIIGIVTQALLTARNYHHDPKKQEVVANNIQEREAYPLLSKPY